MQNGSMNTIFHYHVLVGFWWCIVRLFNEHQPFIFNAKTGFLKQQDLVFSSEHEFFFHVVVVRETNI